MKQFKTILKFELKNYFKNKSFIGSTVFLVLAIAITMFIPKIAKAFKSNQTDADKAFMLVKSYNQVLTDNIENIFGKVFNEYEVNATTLSENEIKDAVISNKADCAFIVYEDLNYDYLVNNRSIYDSNLEIAESSLSEIYRMSYMLQSGLTNEQISEIMSPDIQGNVIMLGKDQSRNFGYTYIMVFALYMVLAVYGQMVASNVATEKSSRTMELLITGTSTTSLMFGKVLSSCIAGLFQMTTVFGSAILFYNMNKSDWGNNPVITSVFDMPLGLFGYMLLFFMLGLFIYAFLYGAIGSTVSKLEDINTAIMPLTFTFIIAFTVVITSMSTGKIDTILMKVFSFIPLTSPMAMFTRIAMSTVPFYEIIISLTILVISVIAIGALSAKIYRAGVLMYGTKPKISTVIKNIWKA